MPEIKHNFTGGKMNKDVDERIVPNGQYRDAMNVQVSTSEGSDVGVIQNILGNELGCSYSINNVNPILPGSATIASISDEKHDTLYWFVSGPKFTKFDVKEKINDAINSGENTTDPIFQASTIATPKYNKDLIMRKTPSGCEPVLVDISGILESSDGMSIQYNGPGNYPLLVPGDTQSTPTWFGVEVPEVVAGMSVVAIGANGSSGAAKVISADELVDLGYFMGYTPPSEIAYLHSLHIPSSGNLVMNSGKDLNQVEVGDQFTIEFLGLDGWAGIGTNVNELYTVLSKDPTTQMINIGDYTEATWANYQASGPGAIRIILKPETIIPPSTNDAGLIVSTVVLDRNLFLHSPQAISGDPSGSVELWNGPYEYLYFFRDGVLNFDKDNLITGVNIIDDMLFWTDNNTEPKKVNIPRSIEGTHVSGNKHTKLVNSSLDIGPKIPQGKNIPLLESHITVIKKSPKTQLLLDLNIDRDPLKNYSGKFRTDEDLSLHDYKEGDIITFGDSGSFNIHTTIEDDTDFSLWAEGENLWGIGTNVVLKEYDEEEAPNVPIGSNYRIKGAIVANNQTPNFAKPNIIKFAVKISSIDGDIPRATGGEYLNWVIDYFKEDIDFFENKLARFSYRYKYEDGEYSTFAPFTQVAFVPGEFDYHPKKGYNLGMTNKLISINLSNFVTKDMPLDVVEIDLLYKEDISPNVYLIDTIKPKDQPLLATQSNYWDKNIYTITSDTIRGALPSNQLLRPWDNVPRKALAQEVTGNRLVYANYLQNYNLINPNGEDFYPYFKHAIINSEPNFDKKSIKSLREYQLGVVFTDKYGRETPVISNSTGTFKLDKAAAKQENRLQVGFNGNIGSVPSDFEYYKFFIKETSGEYYNMAMDRFYDAEDGNYWLAFPSSDRNKVDIDTFLILKKAVDSPDLIPEQARYKILAIENEAPDFIKTKVLNIASANRHAGGDNFDEGEILFHPNDLSDCPVEGVNNFSFNYMPFANTAARDMHDISDDLYIEFSLGGQETSNRYRISSISRDKPYETPDITSKFHVTIDGFLGNDVDFLLNNPSNPSNIPASTEITIYKYVIEDSPKFDGKFFIKIYADPTFNSRMNVNARKIFESFVPKQAGRKMYFMRSSFADDHQDLFNGGIALGNDPSAYPEATDGWWWSSGMVDDGSGGTVLKGIGAGPNQLFQGSLESAVNGCDGCIGLGTKSWADSDAPHENYYNTQSLIQDDSGLGGMPSSMIGYGSRTQSTWFDNHKYFKSFFGPYTAARPEDIINTNKDPLDEMPGCCDPDAINNFTNNNFSGYEDVKNNIDDGSVCLYEQSFLDNLNAEAEIMLAEDPNGTHENFHGFYGMAQEHSQWKCSTALFSDNYHSDCSKREKGGSGYAYVPGHEDFGPDPTDWQTMTPYNGPYEMELSTTVPYPKNQDYIWEGSNSYQSIGAGALAKYINYNFEEIPGPNGTQEDLENNFVTFIDAGPYVESQSSGSNAMSFSRNYAYKYGSDEAEPPYGRGSFDGAEPMNHGTSNDANRRGVRNIFNNTVARFHLGWGGIDSIADRSKWKNSHSWLWYESREKNWWALGQEVGLTGAVDREKYYFIREFLQGFEPGAQFRWKEDPTGQVYTIIEHNGPKADKNLVNYSAGEFDGEWNQMLLNNSGDPYEYSQSNYPKASTYLKPYNFRRTKTFDAVPAITWNPSPEDGYTGPIPNGTYIDKYLPHPKSPLYPDTQDLIASSNLTGACSFNIDKNVFYNSWDTQVKKGLAPITEEMILTHVAGIELDPPVLIKVISEGLSGTDVMIQLKGYTAVLGGGSSITPGGGFLTNHLVSGATLVFQHPTMNGFSPASAKHISSLYPLTCGIGAVGYTWEFVRGLEREALLPEDPSIWETEPKPTVDLDIYYEISGTNPIKLNKHTIKTIFPTGSILSSKEIIDGNSGNLDLPVTIVSTDSALGNVIYLDRDLYIGNNGNLKPIQRGSIFNVTRPDGTSISVSVKGWTPVSTSGNLTQYSFTFELDSFLYKSQYILDWHNCYSFKNGVESNRIRDNFNLPFISNGVKASTTLEGQYKEERRKSGLIYSGIYNSNSGINNLNQFIQAEKITKDVNPIYGSIQKIHSRSTADGDLITLCEDRVLRILANKDAVYNADGNPQLVATENVLGQTVPFSGEFGISTNPESFASESYRVYFADKVRGVILRLSKDGLTPISMYGMKDWFKDNLKLSTKIVGSYDDKKDEYNVTISSKLPVGSIVINSSDARAVSGSGWLPAFLDLEELNSWFDGEDFQQRTINAVSLDGDVLELDSLINNVGLNKHFYTDGSGYDNGTLTFYHNGLEIGTAKVGDLYNSYEAEGIHIDGVPTLKRFSKFITIYELSLGSTVSFREDVKGWVSFKSFIPEIGNSMANDYYTFIGGNLFKHHVETRSDSYTSKSVDRNTFYNRFFPSSVNVILNDGPSIVKTFRTLNYEGSQTKVTASHGDNQYFNLANKEGWYTESFETDKEKGSLKEFIEKEGKWFGYLRGQNVITDDNNYVVVNEDGSSSFDQAGFAIQGIGTYDSIETLPCIGIQGCTNPLADNYDPRAECDDSSCLIPLATWNCGKNQCSDPGDGSGQYNSLSTCQAACSTITWNCVNNVCQDPGDGQGQYSSLSACTESGCGGPLSWNCWGPWNGVPDEFGCVDGGNSGTYQTLIECLESPCPPITYDCNPVGSIGATTNTCMAANTPGTGQYSSIDECNNGCSNPGCTNPDASNYNPSAVGDDCSCCPDAWWQAQTPTLTITPVPNPNNIKPSYQEITLTWQSVNPCTTAYVIKYIDQTTGNSVIYNVPGNGLLTTYTITVPVGTSYLIWVGATCPDSITGIPDWVYGPVINLPYYPPSFNCGVTDNGTIGCIDGGSGGQFLTLQECLDNPCPPPTWSCLPTGPIGATTYGCVFDSTGFGTYSSITECNDPITGCQQVAASWDCGKNGICVDPGTGNGQYSTKTACELVCQSSGDPLAIPGCTESGACNYNSLATVNDGSCTQPYGAPAYRVVFGGEINGTINVGCTQLGVCDVWSNENISGQLYVESVNTSNVTQMIYECNQSNQSTPS